MPEEKDRTIEGGEVTIISEGKGFLTDEEVKKYEVEDEKDWSKGWEEDELGDEEGN